MVVIASDQGSCWVDVIGKCSVALWAVLVDSRLIFASILALTSLYHIKGLVFVNFH